MIKDGRPYTNENGHVDDKLIDSLIPENREKLLNWIRINVHPTKYHICDSTSYGLKHLFEHDTDRHIYITNNQFKDAMLKCGFSPIDPNELNWRYRISNKILDKKKRNLI